MSTRSRQNTTTTQQGSQSSNQNDVFSGSTGSTSTGTATGSTIGRNTDTTQSRQASTYDFFTPPDTADTQALRGYRGQIDPTIVFRLADAKRQQRSSFLNPLGGYLTPQMRDALQRGGEERLMDFGSQAFRQGQYDVNQQDLSRLSSLASLTAPRFAQTGSEGTVTNTGERTEESTGSTSETNTGTSSGTSSSSASGTSSGTGTQQGTTTTPLLPSIISGGAGIGAALL